MFLIRAIRVIRGFNSSGRNIFFEVFTLNTTPQRQHVVDKNQMTSYRADHGRKGIDPFRDQKRMWQSYIFGMHWKHQGKMYYDELSAESEQEAAQYFIHNCRDDVSLVRVELVGPDTIGGVREPAHSPVSPFDPLRARRRLDKDEDAR